MTTKPNQVAADDGASSSDAFTWVGVSGGSWGDGSNWSDVTTGAAPAGVAPGARAGVTIAGPSGSAFEVVTGGGASASLGVSGLVDLAGRYATGALSVGTVTAPTPGGYVLDAVAGALALGVGASVAATTVTVGQPYESALLPGGGTGYIQGASSTLTLTAGAALSATGDLDVANGQLSAGGAGTTVRVGGALVLGTAAAGTPGPDAPYASSASGTLTVTGGAFVQAGGMVLNGTAPAGYTDPRYNYASNTLNVDASSSLDVGAAGSAGAGTLSVDAGHTLTAALGTVLTAPSIVNNGTIADAGGLVVLAGALSGTGRVEIGNNATLRLGGAATGDTLAFTGKAGTLEIGSAYTYASTGQGYGPVYAPYAVTSAIAGLAAGDAILVDNAALTGAVYTATGATTGTLALMAGTTTVATLTLTGQSYSGQTFFISPATTTNPSNGPSTGTASQVSLLQTEGGTTQPFTAKLSSDTGASSSDGITQSAALSGTGAANATVSFLIDGTTHASTMADAGGNWAYTPALTDGSHTIVASESAGRGVSDVSLAVTLDRTAPTLKISSSVASLDDLASSATISFRFSEAVVGFSANDVSVSGGALGAITQSASDPTLYTASFTPAANYNGKATISVTPVADLAGNRSGSASTTVAVATAPTASVETHTGQDAATGDNVIYAQRFAADGSAIGDAFAVTAPGASASPTGHGGVTVLSDGGFVFQDRYTDAAGNVLQGLVQVSKQNVAKQIALPRADVADVDVTPLNNGAFAYIARSTDNSSGTPESRLIFGYQNAAGVGSELVFNQTASTPADPYPVLNVTAASIQNVTTDTFSFSYSQAYSPPSVPGIAPGPSGTRTTTEVFRDDGSLTSTSVTDFDGSRRLSNYGASGMLVESETYDTAGQILGVTGYDASGRKIVGTDRRYDVNGDLAERTYTTYDPATGKALQSSTTYADGSRTDVNDAVKNQPYATQTISYDPTGKVVSLTRSYANGKTALTQVMAGDGSSATHSYDMAGRETSETLTAADGSKSVVNSTYAGMGTTPSSVADYRYAPGNQLLSVDTNNADGSHTQVAKASGVTLASTSAASDTLTSAAGGNDAFVFHASFGQDLLTNFHAGSGQGFKNDTLWFDTSVAPDFQHIQSMISQTRAGALITIDPNDSVLLKGVAASSLVASDFGFKTQAHA